MVARKYIENPDPARAAESALNDSNRSYERYKADLRLEDADFSNKRILDICSGPEMRFAEEIKARVPSAKVVNYDYSLGVPLVTQDPNYVHGSNVYSEEYTRRNQGRKGTTRPAVAGYFTQLPFRDESFDLVISNHGVPLYVHSQSDFYDALSEMIRVVKRQGKGRLCPVTYTRVHEPACDSEDIFVRDQDKELNRTHEKVSYLEDPNFFEQVFKQLRGKAKIIIIPGYYSEMRHPVTRQKEHPSILTFTKKL